MMLSRAPRRLPCPGPRVRRRGVCGRPAEAQPHHQPPRAALHAAGCQPRSPARAAAVGCVGRRAGLQGPGGAGAHPGGDAPRACVLAGLPPRSSTCLMPPLSTALLAAPALLPSTRPHPHHPPHPSRAQPRPTQLRSSPCSLPPPSPQHRSERGWLHLRAGRGCRQGDHHLPGALRGAAAGLAAAGGQLQDLPGLTARVPGSAAMP